MTRLVKHYIYYTVSVKFLSSPPSADRFFAGFPPHGKRKFLCGNEKRRALRTIRGYGDIYPIITIGRIVAMISSAFGIAIIALPSGVITAGYLGEISKDENAE